MRFMQRAVRLKRGVSLLSPHGEIRYTLNRIVHLGDTIPTGNRLRLISSALRNITIPVR